MPSSFLLSTRLLGVSVDDLTTTVVALVVIVVVTVAASRLVTRVIQALLGGSGVGEVSIVVNVARAVLVAFAAFFVGENVFGLEMGVLANALGLTTLLVSLGLQDLIRNAVAGLQIILTSLFSVGDHIEVGGVRGEVLDIGWREVIIRDKDGDPHVIPNTTLIGGQFKRRIGKMARRYEMTCDIKPGLDLDRVAEDIAQLADETLSAHGWRSDEHTEVRFLGATANGIVVSVRIFLVDIECMTKGFDAVMRAIAQRGYLADWTNDNPAQEQWR